MKENEVEIAVGHLTAGSAQLAVRFIGVEMARSQTQSRRDRKWQCGAFVAVRPARVKWETGTAGDRQSPPPRLSQSCEERADFRTPRGPAAGAASEGSGSQGPIGFGTLP